MTGRMDIFFATLLAHVFELREDCFDTGVFEDRRLVHVLYIIASRSGPCTVGVGPRRGKLYTGTRRLQTHRHAGALVVLSRRESLVQLGANRGPVKNILPRTQRASQCTQHPSGAPSDSS